MNHSFLIANNPRHQKKALAVEYKRLIRPSGALAVNVEHLFEAPQIDYRLRAFTRKPPSYCDKLLIVVEKLFSLRNRNFSNWWLAVAYISCHECERKSYRCCLTWREWKQLYEASGGFQKNTKPEKGNETYEIERICDYAKMQRHAPSSPWSIPFEHPLMSLISFRKSLHLVVCIMNSREFFGSFILWNLWPWISSLLDASSIDFQKIEALHKFIAFHLKSPT